MVSTGRAIQALVSQVSELTSQFQHFKVEPTQQPAALNPPAVPDASRTIHSAEPRLPPPTVYSGEPHLCRPFLTKCSLYFSLQPSSFPTEESKVAFAITLLSGRAALWGTTVWDNKHQCVSSFQVFSSELRKVFDRAASEREAARILAELRQTHRTVTDYSIEFRTLAAECSWNAEAQWDMFLHGLAPHIQNEIYALDLPTSLDGFIDLAIRVDARLRRRSQHRPLLTATDRLDRSTYQPYEARDKVSDSEPMQMGQSRLSPDERERRRSRGLCLYCGEAGHIVEQCPVKAGARR